MLPFTPRSRDNLAAWLAARSDGEHYGTLRVFQFPKQKVIFGPRQVVARISQDQTISPQITLWNQQGSQVIWGTLMVIPIEESLIYVRPLYLRASGGRIPELHARDRRLPESDRDGADARRGARAALRRRRRRAAARSRSSSRTRAAGAATARPARPPPPAPPAGADRHALAAEARGALRPRHRGAARGRLGASTARSCSLLGEVLTQMRQTLTQRPTARRRATRDGHWDSAVASVRSHARSTSATVHACAMQPRGVYGSSASKISLSVPMPASLRCADEALEARARARLVVGMELQPRIDERAHQPSPDGALVVRGVARAQVAVVLRLVVAVPGRERAQTDRRQQPLAHDLEDRLPSAPDRAPDGRARSRRSGSAGTPCRRPARRRRRRTDSRPPRTRSAR